MNTNPDEPKVSVVLPVRNRRQLLLRAVNSLAQQDYERFETIVVDDGSDEPIDDLVGSVGLRHVQVLRQPSQGSARARNAGAEVATGEWITFLDSDDEADPAWLSTMVHTALAPQVSIVFCGARRFRDGAQTAVEMPRSSEADPQENLFLAGTFMVRTALFRQIGGYDPTLLASQHTDLGIRLAAAVRVDGTRMIATHEPLVTLHTHDLGNIRSNPEAVAQGAIAMIEKHRETLPIQTLANYHAVAGVNLMKGGANQEDGRRHLRAALKADPKRPVHWFRVGASMVPPLRRRLWHG